MGMFNKNAPKKRRKATTGFSELNRRTYEASESCRMERAKSPQSSVPTPPISPAPVSNIPTQSPNNYINNSVPYNSGASFQPVNIISKTGQNQNQTTGNQPFPSDNTGGYPNMNNTGFNNNSYNSRNNQGQNRGFQQNNNSAFSQNRAMPNSADNQSGFQPRTSAGSTRNKNAGSAGGNFGDYSRDGISNKYSKARKQQQAKSKYKKIAIIAGSVVAGILLILGILYAVVSCNLNSGMDDIGLTPTSLDKPFYMVLMGVDSSEERKADGGTDADYRSDSIILARISAPDKKVSLLSIHRDIEVNMGEYGTQKINAAHSLGGPGLVIKTVSQLCGVDINHYAEINFDGFKAAVDDLGGVEIDVPMEIVDELAGYVPEGHQLLNGDQALAMCRSRHAFDDYGDGDKYRAANQRAVLTAIAKQVLSSDIFTIANTATDLSKYIKTDLALNDMIGLAQLMKGLDPNKDIYSAMTPTEGILTGGVWYEQLDKEELAKMMKRMDAGEPPSDETVIDPLTGTVMSSAGRSDDFASITVRVENGTDTAGLASSASNKLVTMGFSSEATNADKNYLKTIIVYNVDDKKGAAEAICKKLGCGSVSKNSGNYTFGTDILVIVGDDFASL